VLLHWYRRHRRDLPWRRTRDPYRIWVSEVMLQQTQVATAAPYYQSFLARFPTIDALSRAREADVLEAWSGLGYYRRARMLHEAARMVVHDYASRVPDDPEAFGRLPGVGRYTRGAVLSIAFDRPLAALDGNVTRVLSRLLALAAPLKDPAATRRLWAEAEALVPARKPGEWNQALMELGALVCTPRAPRCDDCPCRAHCRAFAAGDPERYPGRAPRRATERHRRAVAVVEHRGRWVMVRREGPLLAGLWEPPAVDLGENGGSAARKLRSHLVRLGVSAALVKSSERVRHRITHRAIEAEIWVGAASRPESRNSQLVRLIDPVRPGVPLTGLARRLVRLRSRFVPAKIVR